MPTPEPQFTLGALWIRRSDQSVVMFKALSEYDSELSFVQYYTGDSLTNVDQCWHEMERTQFLQTFDPQPQKGPPHVLHLQTIESEEAIMPKPSR